MMKKWVFFNAFVTLSGRGDCLNAHRTPFLAAVCIEPVRRSRCAWWKGRRWTLSWGAPSQEVTSVSGFVPRACGACVAEPLQIVWSSCSAALLGELLRAWRLEIFVWRGFCSMVGCVIYIVIVGSVIILIFDRFTRELAYKSAYMERQSIVSGVYE